MLVEPPVHLILGQAIIEYGLLDTLAAALTNARYQLEFYIGEGNTVYLAAAVVVLLVLTRVRRRG